MLPPLNIITPLPPKKSGIANYALKVSTALSKYFQITFIVDQTEYDLEGADFEVIQFAEFTADPARRQALSLLHMGNNPDHIHVYRAADHVTGLIVQHDLALHHFIESITLAEGRFEEYLRILQQEYGDAGRSIAMARRIGIFDDSTKFLFPAVSHFVRKGCGAIVHSNWAVRRLRSVMDERLFCIPHFVEQDILDRSAAAMRAEPEAKEVFDRFGIPEGRFVIGMLGFATEPKCIREVTKAFVQQMKAMPDLHLVIGGEVHISGLDAELKTLRDAGRLTVTGYLNRNELEYICARLNLLFNLRFPTVGESSGILSMAMGFGTPCAVFDFGPMAEFSHEEVFRIPFHGTGDVLVASLANFLAKVRGMPAEAVMQLGLNAKTRMQKTAAIDVVCEDYRRAIESVMDSPMLAVG